METTEQKEARIRGFKETEFMLQNIETKEDETLEEFLARAADFIIKERHGR